VIKEDAEEGEEGKKKHEIMFDNILPSNKLNGYSTPKSRINLININFDWIV